jgi:DNA repair exonuclease SbcCD ATPase subunit
MQIKILQMVIKNFKGIKSFVLQTEGKNISILADNGVGKTTLFDAFKWLLFDKDSTNRKDFAIKTHDKNGDVIHCLEHEVEAQLSIDGTILTLKKQFTEKWTKKRGEAEKEFTGHETAYWVDEVPVKKGEFQQRINEVIDENIFKLLTDPFYFNLVLSKEERKKILLEISGNISDEDVIASDDKLKDLLKILNGKSTDDFKKIIAEKRSKLNKEIEKIPVRIDEISINSTEEEVDYEEIEQRLEKLNQELEAIENSFTDIQAKKDRVVKGYQDLASLKSQQTERERQIEKDANTERNELVRQKASLMNDTAILHTQIDNLNRRINTDSDLIAMVNGDIQELRNDWDKKKAEMFEEPDRNEFSCPTCKQVLPTDAIDEKIADLRECFEVEKNRQLSIIQTKGKSLKAGNDERQNRISNMQVELAEKTLELKNVEEHLSECTGKLENINIDVDYTSDSAWIELKEKIDKLQSKLEIAPAYDTAELMEQKKAIQSDADLAKAILAKKEYAENNKKRIEELKQEEKTLAAQLNELDKQIFLIEQFIRTKVKLLEEGINNKFKHVNFKMFDVQINGGIVETCETLVNGVPWSDANHAGKVNAGLDIICTLAEHYKVHAPIYIDFRESVTNIIPTGSQIINLIKTTGQKTLKVELEG